MLNNPFLRRIGSDLRVMGLEYGTGIARYRTGLHTTIRLMGANLELLTDRPGEMPSRETSRSTMSNSRRWLRIIADRQVFHSIPDVFRRAQRQFSLTGRLLEVRLENPPELFHWSHPQPLYVRDAVNIYTLHDFIPLENPELSSIPARRFERLLRRLADVAAGFVTVSRIVKGQAVAHLGLSDEKVRCCYSPVAAVEGNKMLPPGLSPDGYLLCLGRFEARKNVESLIHAYVASGVPVPLVFVGPEGAWPNRATRQRVEDLLTTPGVIRIPWQDDVVVGALIAGSRAVLMPSLAEGFGLPAIEAMAHGVPTLASARGAAAEIAGDGALLVDPEDTPAMAAAITLLCTDADLRSRLIARGLVRAAVFTPERHAASLASFYHDLLATQRGPSSRKRACA